MVWSQITNDAGNLDSTLLLFRLAITVMGVGVLLIGLVLYFYKPKDKNKQSSHSARLTALISFGMIGVATTLYAWLWFGS